MDARQLTYLAAMVLITALAWRQWRIMAVLWVNVAITLAWLLAADLGAITMEQAAVRSSAGDLVCAVILLAMGGLARVTAYISLPMPLFALSAIVMGYGTYDAYTLGYVLAYIQLAVVWVGNGPFDNDRRGSGHRGYYRGRGGFLSISGGGLLYFAGRNTCVKVGVEKGGGR